MSRVGIITQARTTSSRLPGKILLNVGGKSILQHHLDRLKWARLPVYVATTLNDADGAVVSQAAALGVPTYRGSEQDVLSRFAGAAEEFGLDVVVRVTSDCPLIDGALVRSGVDAFMERDEIDLYLSNTLERTYPRGFDFEVFSADLLREANLVATRGAEREHVTPYMYWGPRTRAKVVQFTRAGDSSAFRLTLDTAADLAVLTSLIEQHGADSLKVEEIIALLRGEPALAAINSHIPQKVLE